jgi:hypothetical protein
MHLSPLQLSLGNGLGLQ